LSDNLWHPFVITRRIALPDPRPEHFVSADDEEEPVSLDRIDRAILDVLREDARTSVSVLAHRVNVSRANAYARVRRLTDEGVILGYGLRTDPVREGFHSSAYVALSVEQSAWQDIRAHLLGMPEVDHVALVGGEFDVLVLVRATDNRHLRRVVLEQIQSAPGVRATRTFLVFEDIDAAGGHDAETNERSTP
jgi:DNA-binding Lrp family transcriptional regulator